MARDIIIIGGGIIGLTAAHHLSAAGLSVALLDQSPPGRGASWAGAGILPPGDPQFAATPTDLLRSISTSRFAEYSARLLAETGIENGYRRSRAVERFDAPETDYPKRWEAQRIDHHDIGLFEGHRWYQLNGFAQVRNPRHLRALEAACRRARCDIRPNIRAAGFHIHDGSVTGVRLASGEVLAAEYFVVAAGAWAEPLLRQVRVQIPVRPVRGQIVLFNDAGSRGNDIVLVGKRYIVPRGDGRVLVGSTEEDSGFNAMPTRRDAVELIDFARRTAGLRASEVEATWAGLRPSSPDNRPTIGFAPESPNVILAVGHFRAGIQQSIGTALLIKNLVLGEVPIIPIGPFAADREIGPPDASAFRS